jgi:hypothetical protein
MTSLASLPAPLLEAVLEFLPVEVGLGFRQVSTATRFLALRPGALRLPYGSGLLHLLDVRRLAALELVDYNALKACPVVHRLDCLSMSMSFPVLLAQNDELSSWLASLQLTSLRLVVHGTALLTLRAVFSSLAASLRELNLGSGVGISWAALPDLPCLERLEFPADDLPISTVCARLPKLQCLVLPRLRDAELYSPCDLPCLRVLRCCYPETYGYRERPKFPVDAWSSRLEVLFLRGFVLGCQLSALSGLRSLTLTSCIILPPVLDLRTSPGLESCIIDAFGDLVLLLPSAIRELALKNIRLSSDLFSHRLRLDDRYSLTRLVLSGYAPHSESDTVLPFGHGHEFPNVVDLGLCVRQASYANANWAEFLALAAYPLSVRRLELDVSESHVYNLLTHFTRVSDLKLRLDCETARWDGVLALVRDKLAVTRLDISGAMLTTGARVIPGLRQALLYFCMAGKVLVPVASVQDENASASCSIESVRQAVWPWDK